MNGLEQIGIARLQVVAECFFLPPEGCVPHWKTRPASHFKEARAATAFNTRFAAIKAQAATWCDFAEARGRLGL